jgi:hypothetical protein
MQASDIFQFAFYLFAGLLGLSLAIPLLAFAIAGLGYLVRWLVGEDKP